VEDPQRLSPPALRWLAALATPGLGLDSGTAIPGAEWLLDWRDSKKSVQENGLHYLLNA